MSKHSDTAAILKAIGTKDSAYWERIRKARALDLFHRAAVRVPAYKNFLKTHKIWPDKIKRFSDLQYVPHVTKDNYLRQYSLSELSWDGTLDKPLVYTSTSGSTGKPLYFHRSFGLDWQSSLMHEMYWRSQAKASGPTLVIVCFGMGVWIGGLITYQAFRLMKERGHNLSLITPGINKEEIFRALRTLAPLYAQTVLIGYPPFIKDIIDEAGDEHINLKKLNLRILCAAEPFTERFRDYLARKTGSDRAGISNIYGTADLGTMAIETPRSIAIRTAAVKRPPLFEALFRDINKTPTLCQYIPEFISFDSEPNGELVITGDSSLPLVRYAIGDRGGTYTAAEIGTITSEVKISQLPQTQLPFVYVYERVDTSTTLYGLQVYPEPLREVFLLEPFQRFFTGKFVLETIYDRKQDQYLQVHIELRRNQKVVPNVRKLLLRALVGQLEDRNSEFHELHRMLGRRVWPKLSFWPAEYPKYFRPGIKQRWVKK